MGIFYVKICDNSDLCALLWRHEILDEWTLCFHLICDCMLYGTCYTELFDYDRSIVNWREDRLVFRTPWYTVWLDMSIFRLFRFSWRFATPFQHLHCVLHGFCLFWIVRPPAINRTGKPFQGIPHKYCCTMPLFHVFALAGGLIAPILTGSTVLLPSAHFDPKATVNVITEDKWVYAGTDHG